MSLGSRPRQSTVLSEKNHATGEARRLVVVVVVAAITAAVENGIWTNSQRPYTIWTDFVLVCPDKKTKSVCASSTIVRGHLFFLSFRR